MRIWKWLGVASIVGVSSGVALLAARRRRWRNYEADELRTRLHDRLAEADEPLR